MPSALKEINHWCRSLTRTEKRRNKPLIFSFLIAVYLLILSMVVFNSGTLSLWGCWSQPPWTPPSLPPPVPKRKKIYFCFSEKKILILMHLLLLFRLIYFHFISFYLLFVIILWVFIYFFCLIIVILLFLWVYKVYICILYPWVTPLLSWARSTLKGVV